MEANKKIKVVFLGTPQIACKPLAYLLGCEDIEVMSVISQPDKPAGRGHKFCAPPVKAMVDGQIEVCQPFCIRKDEFLIDSLKNLNPDFLITVAFGQILSQEVLDIPKYGTVNLHASLLPKYRGANPIARAIANGETETGVTTMLTSIGVDEGHILQVRKFGIGPDDTTLDLAIKIADIGGEILHTSMIGLANGHIIPQQQNHSEATFAPKFSKEEFIIDFNKSAREIHNLTRALCPRPNSQTTFNGVLLKITETKVIDRQTSASPGEIIQVAKEGVYVATGDGVLLISRIKPESKKEMNAFDWTCGSSSCITTGARFN
ncbi:MAG: methionyl-tRNA formyltransferase [Candidatus Gastranaerophilales bacterium]|nr:methionyl-tRNA formyltransferase [Candidatus Gastranaerophilales bacterium]